MNEDLSKKGSFKSVNGNDTGKNPADNGISEQELLKFISRIIACGTEGNIMNALEELEGILSNEGANLSTITLVRDAVKAAPELASLGTEKKNKDVTRDEFGKALREARERIRREEAYRC